MSDDRTRFEPVHEPASPDQAASGRLNSWKEIARHLNVSVSTTIRWEKSEGLPVHRHRHHKLSSLYAYKSELDQWRISRSPEGRPSHPLPWQVPLQVSREPSIAVLPFLNLGHAEEDEILSDGLTEELISALSGISGLRVVARTSCFYFKGRPTDIREVAQRLGVRTVLEGSLRRSGNRIRVSAQLIRAEDGCHISSHQFDREMDDLLDVQEEISKSIVRVLRCRLADDDRIRGLNRYTRDPEACRIYLKGRHYFTHMLSGWPQVVIRCFEQCLMREPKLAPALAGLADCYSVLAWMGLMQPGEAMRLARTAAQRALEIDQRLAEAHISLGLILAAQYDWKEAEVELLKALDLDPDSAMAHLWYAGGILASQGRLDEAHSHQEEAYKSDPVNPGIAVGFAADLLFYREYEQAVEAAKRALELEPLYPMAYRWIGEAFLLLGRYEEAEAALVQLPMPSIGAGYLGYCYAHTQRTDRAIALLRQLECPPGDLPAPLHQIAILQLGLGDFDAMFRSLELARQACHFGITWLLIDPIWDTVRGDPRFSILLKRMNLR